MYLYMYSIYCPSRAPIKSSKWWHFREAFTTSYWLLLVKIRQIHDCKCQMQGRHYTACMQTITKPALNGTGSQNIWWNCWYIPIVHRIAFLATCMQQVCTMDKAGQLDAWKIDMACNMQYVLHLATTFSQLPLRTDVVWICRASQQMTLGHQAVCCWRYTCTIV